MGLLVDGLWQDKWYDTKKSGGKFVRSKAQFRSFIEADSNFTPEKVEDTICTFLWPVLGPIEP